MLGDYTSRSIYYVLLKKDIHLDIFSKCVKNYICKEYKNQVGIWSIYRSFMNVVFSQFVFSGQEHTVISLYGGSYFYVMDKQ